MSGVLKGTSRRVWLKDEQLAKLKSISEHTNLSQTELLSQIIHAGLNALAAKGGKFELPLQFRVGPSPYSEEITRVEEVAPKRR